MIRRGAAGIVLGLSLFAASLAWSGFIALRTVLDPGRSQDVAESLYDDEAVREQLIDNIARAVTAGLPAEVPLTDEQVEQAGRVVLDDPRVEALFTGALVQTHAAFLGEGEVPKTLDAGAFGAAARDALVGIDPALDPVLPAAPELSVELPTDRVPNAGPLRRFTQAVVPGLAAIAAIGVAFALLTTTDRPSVLRRAGWWAFGASWLIVAISFGVPWVARNLAPDQAEVISALIGALTRSARAPSVVLGVAGVVAVLASYLWPEGGGQATERGEVAPRRRPVERPAPVAHAAPPRPRAAPPAPRPAASSPPAPRPAASSPPAPRPAASSPPAPRPAASSPPAPRPAASSPPAPRPAASSPPAPTGPAAPVAAVSTKWVEGVGWVVDPNSKVFPPDARWVPGVGYVLDRAPD